MVYHPNESEYYEVGTVEQMRKRVEDLKELKRMYDEKTVPTLKSAVEEFKRKKAYYTAASLTETMNDFKERSYRISEFIIPQYLSDIQAYLAEEKAYTESAMKARKVRKGVIVIPKMPKLNYKSVIVRAKRR